MWFDIGVFAGSLVGTKMTEKRLDHIGKQIKYEKPLYDVLHNSLPNLKAYDGYIDLIPLLLGIHVVLLIMKGNPDIEVKKIIRQLSILFIIRILTTSMTILPSPICSSSKNACAIGGCHDCIFSGHTAVTLLLSFHIFRSNSCRSELLILYNIIGSLLIISTRNHYTIDVMIAWIVVYALIKHENL